MDRPTKISFGDMRAQGVRGLLIYCADYRCSHSIAINSDHWPDDARLSDIDPRFICGACGHRGADGRSDFNWNKEPVVMMVIADQMSQQNVAGLFRIGKGLGEPMTFTADLF